METISGITKNPKSTTFIFQAISMAVQRGNVQCVQGAYPPVDLHWFFEIFIRTEKKIQLELKKKIS